MSSHKELRGNEDICHFIFTFTLARVKLSRVFWDSQVHRIGREWEWNGTATEDSALSLLLLSWSCFCTENGNFLKTNKQARTKFSLHVHALRTGSKLALIIVFVFPENFLQLLLASVTWSTPQLRTWRATWKAWRQKYGNWMRLLLGRKCWRTKLVIYEHEHRKCCAAA